MTPLTPDGLIGIVTPDGFLGMGGYVTVTSLTPKRSRLYPLLLDLPPVLNARKFVSLLIRKIWCSKIKEETNYHIVVFNLYAPLGVL